MLLELLFFAHLGVGFGFGAPYDEVGGAQEVAQGFHEDGVGFQVVAGLIEGGREGGDTLAGAVVVGEGGRVYLGGLGRFEAALYAVKAGGEQTAKSDVGVARAVGGFELQVGGAFYVAPEGGGDADGRLAVVVAPDDVGAAPCLGLEALVGVEAGACEGYQTWEV